MQDPKRSNEPLVWLLFGAGTTISAILFPVLILAICFLIPFNLISGEQAMKTLYYFIHCWYGKIILLGVLVLPVWGALHRIHHGLHDLKIHLPASGAIFYGLAGLFSVLAMFAVF